MREPTEFAIYAQDKIEYGDMIINVGLRYESFNPKAKIPNNIHEPYIKDPRNPALDTLSVSQLENINWGDISYSEIDSNGNEVSYTYADYYSRFNDQPNLNQKTGWWKNTTVKSPSMNRKKSYGDSKLIFHKTKEEFILMLLQLIIMLK